MDKRKISVEIKNKHLNALEDLLYAELNQKEKATASKQVKQLWQVLVEAYEKKEQKKK